MAESPTAYWCPECGFAAMNNDQPHRCRPGVWTRAGSMIEVPVLTPGLSLADLAVRLRDAGYTAGNHWRIPPDEDVLVVAAKAKVS